MFAGRFGFVRTKALSLLGPLLLCAALTAAYANHFQNSFHFDDAHTIVNNAAIRDIKNIPRFFTDARTFSSLPSNQSYRPLVSTLLAIDHKLGGLNPFWFHLSIFTLFLGLLLLLCWVINRFLQSVAPSPRNLWIAGGATACYGLHPANADTVNYVIASSEVISTLGVVASFAVYFRFPHLRGYYLFVLPAAIAILAKPPAAVFAVLFAVYRSLFAIDEARPKERMLRSMLEVVPPLIICAAMLLFVHAMTPRTWISGAAGARNYLITQPFVALLYFKTFFWPNDLSADYDLNPFTTTDDPRFWLGFAFVAILLTVAILTARARKTRVVGFGLLWFLTSLLPTSLLPLAEVMNDHRTFLPYIGLVIAVAGATSLLVAGLRQDRAWPKIALSSAAVLVLCSASYATSERNGVWRTEETLWRDVTIKSPSNPRGLMNYGLTLMAKGDFTGALDYFHRALKLAPQYPVLLINLAIAEDATKQEAIAEQHFQEALRLAPRSPDSFTYYARSLLARSRAEEARVLARTALQLSPNDVTARELLKQAEARVGEKMAPPTAESYLSLSLQLYRAERYLESVVAGRRALDVRPNYAEAWNNIGAAYNKLGRFDEAVLACEQALRLQPGFELARNNLAYALEMTGRSAK